MSIEPHSGDYLHGCETWGLRSINPHSGQYLHGSFPLCRLKIRSICVHGEYFTTGDIKRKNSIQTNFNNHIKGKPLLTWGLMSTDAHSGEYLQKNRTI